jgi:hypothetical protein
MLAYLLDENISPVVAEQVAAKNQRIQVHTIHHWRGGEFLGQTDERILRAASEERLTLVSYDLKTIPPLLQEFAADREFHAGLLFVDDSSIRGNDIRGLVIALLAHWQRYSEEEWENRVAFLTAE